MNPMLAPLMLGLFAVAPPAGKREVHLGQETRNVKDRVGLFSPAAVKKAQDRIDRIRDAFKMDLTVETISSIPGMPGHTLRRMDNRKRDDFLRETAVARADEASGNGLYILIINNPRHVTIVGWPATRELDITGVQRRRLQKYLMQELPDDPDRALLGTCDIFRNQVEAIQPSPAAPLALPMALLIVGSIFALWVVLRILRARVVSPALPIYQPAMFGSLFGVPAGYWINDRLFEAEQPTTPPAPVTPPVESAAAALEPAAEESVPGDPLIESDPVNAGERP